MSKFSKAGVLLLAVSLGGCGMSSLLDSDRTDRGQPFPATYRPDLLAFFKTYLKDPVAVRTAALAAPIERTVNGQPRFVACVKFSAHESDGSYRGIREHAVLFVDGHLDRVIDDIADLCAGATYAAFPELEKMTR